MNEVASIGDGNVDEELVYVFFICIKINILESFVKVVIVIALQIRNLKLLQLQRNIYRGAMMNVVLAD
jgi:hypothetical protein